MLAKQHFYLSISRFGRIETLLDIHYACQFRSVHRPRLPGLCISSFSVTRKCHFELCQPGRLIFDCQELCLHPCHRIVCCRCYLPAMLFKQLVQQPSTREMNPSSLQVASLEPAILAMCSCVHPKVPPQVKSKSIFLGKRVVQLDLLLISNSQWIFLL